MKKILTVTAVLLIAAAIAAVFATKGELSSLLPEAESGALETSKGYIDNGLLMGSGSDTVQTDTRPVATEPETPPHVTEPPATEPPITAPPVTTPPVTEPPKNLSDIPPSPPSYFDSSLFIGDSRTVGLREFADLGNATVFATKGMNVFRVAGENVNVPGHGNTDLDGILREKSYDKIYIMLGINEIGYNENSVIKKYTQTVNHVRAAQPNAVIYLQANLHITANRSNYDDVYNNANLDRLNAGMAALANGRDIFYIDANSVFDDENGCLAGMYAADDFHLLGRYYSLWADWIAQNS